MSEFRTATDQPALRYRLMAGCCCQRPWRRLLDVETGAKGEALAGEHHGAQASIIFEPRAGFGDRSEHSRIEGVHLVGAIEPDIGDAVCDREPDAIFRPSPFFCYSERGERGCTAPRRQNSAGSSAPRQSVARIVETGEWAAQAKRAEELAIAQGDRQAKITQHCDHRESNTRCLRRPARALSDAIRTAQA